MTFSLSVETVLGAELILDGDVERDITFGEIGNSPRFEIEVFNSGNVESEFKIFSSSGMRGWSVILSYDAILIAQTMAIIFCVLLRKENQ